MNFLNLNAEKKNLLMNFIENKTDKKKNQTDRPFGFLTYKLDESLN